MADNRSLHLLNRALAHARTSPFYRDRIPGEALCSVSDLARLPLLRKDDLRGLAPYDLLCVEREALYEYHESFGTTGIPVPAWYTKEDMRDNALALTGLGVEFNKNDIVLIRFPYAISAIAHFMHDAAQSKGACVVPVSSRSTVSPYPRVIDLLRKINGTVLACLPQQAILLAETAELMGLRPQVDFPSLRALCTAGEPLPPGRRRLLEETWGVPVYDNYGLTESGVIAVDCAFKRTHPVDEAFHLEILRDDTAEPAAPGETGWLVLTTLRQRAMPLIRYFTGDRAALRADDCPCGQRLSLCIHGRAESRVEINGQRLDLWDLDAIVSLLPPPFPRFWAAGPTRDGLGLVLGRDDPIQCLPESLAQIEERFNLRLYPESIPTRAFYDRADLLAVDQVGKPHYTYTAAEMAERRYLGSACI